MPTNDNDRVLADPVRAPSDAHGRAALLLVESLIHGLCESARLRPNEAIEIAERAAGVQLEQAQEADGGAASMWRSHALLSSIATSLRTDGEGASSPHGRSSVE